MKLSRGYVGSCPVEKWTTTCYYTVSLLLLMTRFLLRSKFFALSIFNYEGYEGIGASSVLLLLIVALLLMVLDMNLEGSRKGSISSPLN